MAKGGRGHVARGRVASAAELRALIEAWPGGAGWHWSSAAMEPLPGPLDPLPEGRLAGSGWELRWRREGMGYEVLCLSRAALAPSDFWQPIAPPDGEHWQTQPLPRYQRRGPDNAADEVTTATLFCTASGVPQFIALFGEDAQQEESQG